jgi:hypothetical protein
VSAGVIPCTKAPYRELRIVPVTSSFAPGLVVPIQTLPLLAIAMLLTASPVPFAKNVFP